MAKEEIPKKRELPPIERFRNQNIILRSFGETGLRVFGAVDGKRDAEGIMKASNCTLKEYEKIIAFMRGNGMLEETSRFPKDLTRSVKQMAGGGGSIGEKNEEGEEEKEKKSMGADNENPDEENNEIEKDGKEKESGKDDDDDEETGKGRKGKESGNGDNENDDGENPEEDAISPEEETPAGKGKKKNSKKEGRERKAISPELKIAQSRTREIGEEDAQTSALSPLEKKIFQKYGALGVDVYNLIDGQKTAEEIMLQTKISEVKLVEILEFLENEGIIKLEKPANAGKVQAPAGMGEKEERIKTGAHGMEGEGGKFSPMVDETPLSGESSVMRTEEEVGGIPIDVPMKAKMNFMQEAGMQAGLIAKFKANGTNTYKLLGSGKDIVEMALQMRASLDELDGIFTFLGEKKAALFKKLSREEARGKYGDDGLAVYKKFGREGVLVYELIGREKTLTDVVIRSRVPPKRAVEILLFVHKVLGLEIPLNADLLYKQLGISAD